MFKSNYFSRCELSLHSGMTLLTQERKRIKVFFTGVNFKYSDWYVETKKYSNYSLIFSPIIGNSDMINMLNRCKLCRKILFPVARW